MRPEEERNPPLSSQLCRGTQLQGMAPRRAYTRYAIPVWPPAAGPAPAASDFFPSSISKIEFDSEATELAAAAGQLGKKSPARHEISP